MQTNGRTSQAGEGKVGLIIALVLLGIAIHTGLAYMPNYMRDNEFKDYVMDNLKEVGAQLMDEDEFFVDVVEKAVDMGIDLTEGDIEFLPGKGEVGVIINYEYTNNYLWGESEKSITIDAKAMKM